MKILVTESQYKKILREEKEQEILHIPSLKFFNEDWDLLQKFLKSIGNPPYTIGGDLDLHDIPIKSIGSLISVGGDLDLEGTQIESLGNLQSVGGKLDLEATPIKSLGNLQSVGGDLWLKVTPIESLGNLQSVGGDLTLYQTPLFKKYTKQQIRQMVDVGGEILF
jgi:hypothetical protein